MMTTPDSESASPVEIPDVLKPHLVDMEYMSIGCFPLVEGDARSATPILKDPACMDHKQNGVCRSGLPFFRLLVEKTNAVRLCFSFCSSKGSDIFGILGMDDDSASQAECRCGASMTNYNFWAENGLPKGTPDSSLILDMASKLSSCDADSIRVYDYNGWKRYSHGVQSAMLDIKADEHAYMKSIVLGSSL
jgi:hypothetical protein